MVDIEISFTEVGDITKAVEYAKIALESGKHVLISHRPSLSGVEPKYRKWFTGGGLADAGLIEKDIREGCRY